MNEVGWGWEPCVYVYLYMHACMHVCKGYDFDQSGRVDLFGKVTFESLEGVTQVGIWGRALSAESIAVAQSLVQECA
jgi:hypothetical protein